MEPKHHPQFVLARLLAVIVVVLSLAACAAPARMGAMTAEVSKETIIQKDAALFQAVEIRTVSGGEETNPLWTSEIGSNEFKAALRNSLDLHTILSKGPGKLVLDAFLLTVDQPLIGLDMTVTAQVRYLIVDKSSKSTYFEDTINTPYTAKLSDSFYAVERLRLANEGAAKANISEFLKRLIAHSGKSADSRNEMQVVVSNTHR